MATSSKESRRRKILERGSDRLASITGQLENLPPPPPPHSENQIDTNPTPPSTAPLARDPPPDSPSQIAVSPEVHDEASSSDANQTQPSAYNGIGEGSTSTDGIEASGLLMIPR
ncbi:uncharacterized protein LOC120211895 [Hibiscus syriacus]|uniref:uncharacterized protein LOC120211895 n=1 Tax=Hibiscus syriacus TaxID=106335 RepID=UPI001921F92F|nr:uncharacterized protein LOC120211895 [Hibiscus syriacus]